MGRSFNLKQAMTSTIINREVYLGSKEEKEITELEDIDAHVYKLLGRATGISIDHCVILGMNHEKNFWHRVCAYKRIQDRGSEAKLFEVMKKIKPETEPYMTIEFYERV